MSPEPYTALSTRRRRLAEQDEVNSRTVLITNFPASWPTGSQALTAKVSELLQKFGNLRETPIIASSPCKLGTNDVTIAAYASFEDQDSVTKAIKCLHGTDNRSGDEERSANYAPPSERQRYYVQTAVCVPSKSQDDAESEERASKIAKAEAPHFLRVGMQRLRAEPPPLHNLSLILQKQLAIISQCQLPERGSQSCELLGQPSKAAPCASDEERVTLVLDLDGTLVECRPTADDSSLVKNAGMQVELESTLHTVYFRPKAHVFLATVAHMFEVVVFTASMQSYADQVLDYLDPEGKFISARLYRQHCLPVPCGPGQVVFIKDMSVLGRPLERVILVDDSPISHLLTPDNGIIVSPWTAEESSDIELLELLVALRECRHQAAEIGSVTKYLAQRYGLKAFFEVLRSFLEPQPDAPS